ncbi:metal-dependent hydrolase [Desulfococcaceae bacterium HSG8]|nr:metal-dependent hydrolase [Desulfococcaceae bacterium HSG8]
MADFKTHLYGACLTSGLLATTLVLGGVAESQEIFMYFVMGITGGILPDVDMDKSVPMRLAFDFLAPVLAFPVVFSQSAGHSVAELFLIWITAFFTIRYFLPSVLSHLTVHRGLTHSVPAGVICCFLAAIFLRRVFRFSDFDAWMGGFFLLFGFIVHLILDEINSLDMSAKRLKKSLGTAFKLGDPNDSEITILLYISIIVLFFLTPDIASFFKIISDKSYSSDIHLLPQGHWFEGVHKSFTGWWK